MKMAELNIGMKLEDSRTDEIFTVVEKNSKYKTVMLEGEDGTTRTTALATITKHFTEVVELDDLSTPGEEVSQTEEESSVDVEVTETQEEVEPEDEEKPAKKERKKKDTSELEELLPFDTLVPAHGGLAVKVGRKRLFEIYQNTRTGVFTIASHLPTLDDIGLEYIPKKGYGIIKIDNAEAVVDVLLKFKEYLEAQKKAAEEAEAEEVDETVVEEETA